VMTTVYYKRMSDAGKAKQGLMVLACFIPVLIVAGFALRPFGGIAKLGDTPSWILICTGISVASLIVLAYVTDIQNKQNWWRLIKPAGTITLTCYLLPDIHIAIIKLLGPAVRVPLFFRTGGVGILKSLVFAFLIVLLTGVLEKKKIKLSV
jgi:heparan-alpha-glucosaminide N-acetyltransferase